MLWWLLVVLEVDIREVVTLVVVEDVIYGGNQGMRAMVGVCGE